ncbi:hypothetical protein Nmel_017418 [Mimus melanotis]
MSGKSEQRGSCSGGRVQSLQLCFNFLLFLCPSLQARGADIPDIPGELPLRSCGSTASMKVKNVRKYIPPGLMGCDAFHRLSFTKGHFPKMAECAHFHYENVDFGNIQPGTCGIPGSCWLPGKGGDVKAVRTVCHKLLRKILPWNKITPVKFQVPCFFPLVKWEEIQCGFCHGRITLSVEL